MQSTGSESGVNAPTIRKIKRRARIKPHISRRNFRNLLGDIKEVYYKGRRGRDSNSRSGEGRRFSKPLH